MTSIALPLRVPSMEFDDSIIKRPASILKSFVIAADLAGLDDKQAAEAACMDAATWSRFKQGQVGMKPDALDVFFDRVNELPLHNMAYRRGFHLVPRKTEMERRLAEVDEKLKREQEENRVLRSLLHGRSA